MPAKSLDRAGLFAVGCFLPMQHSLPSKSWLRTGTLSLLSAALAVTASAAEPLYQNDFEKAAPGAAPQDLLVISGVFTVRSENGNQALELPGSPLDSFGALFGPAPEGDVAASARFFGTKQGRKFPTFGVSLNGAGGYRLQVSPGKKALEIYRGDTSLASVAWEWQPGTWTTLRLEVRKVGEGCVIQGKAWQSSGEAPADWSIRAEEKESPAPGRAGIWGSPYAGTPILFDDLRLEAVSP